MEQSRPRWVRALVAAFVAFELVAAVVLVRQSRDGGEQPPTATQTTGQRQDSGDKVALLRTVAVQGLLERRAHAIRTRDRTAFSATLDFKARDFAQRQLAVFDALAAVPLESWRYDVDPEDTARVRDDRGADEAWAPRVTLRYRLRGYDDSDAASDQFFTFVRRGQRWLVAADDDFARDGRRTARHLWDFGTVSVVRGDAAMVLGHPGTHAFLRDVARHADDAVPRVTAVWGRAWPERVVVLVPATQDETGAILGDDGDLSRIAAVSVAELPGRRGDRPSGNRIVVNPPNFRRLGNTGRRVVMTHEVTHVATRDAGAVGVPTWLVEGFADYVGYLRSGLPARTICQELARDVRAGRAPTALPKDTAFDGGNTALAQAYESAWLAVRLVGERLGQRGLVRFYRTALTAGTATAFADVLHLTEQRFVALWRDYVRQTLG